MTAFFNEATRLWDLDPYDQSLTRIHAGICLCKIYYLGTASAPHILISLTHLKQRRENCSHQSVVYASMEVSTHHAHIY
jgi:hypothetical protein